MTLCSRGHRYERTTRHGRCPICEPERNRERMRDPRHRVYGTSRWRKTRAIVRARDGNRCAYADETCSGGLEVHHVVPTRFDSSQFFELENLELVCRVHHSMREREAKIRPAFGDELSAERLSSARLCSRRDERNG
jgi:5-methylcytosine-specific restriction endonuclease McrA